MSRRQFTISAADQGPFDLDLDADNALLSEARAVRRLGRWSWDEWLAALIDGDPDAVALAWWLARSRAGQPVEDSLADIDFRIGTLRIVPADDPDAEPLEAEQPGPTGPTPEPAGATSTS